MHISGPIFRTISYKSLSSLLFCSILLLSLLLHVTPLSAASLADGSGAVRVVPAAIAPASPLNVSFLLTATNNTEAVTEIEMTFPPYWNFSGDTLDVSFAGNGLTVAKVHSITGSGQTWAPFVMRITGAAITTAQVAEIRISRLTAPQYIGDATNPANTFTFRTQGLNGVFQPIATQPGISTTGSTKPHLLITEFSMKEDQDFIELYCVNDNNQGAGSDMINYVLSEMSAATADKVFASLIVHTGDFVVLHYNQSGTDTTLARESIAHVYTTVTGLPDDDGQILLSAGSTDFQDAVPYADMNNIFVGYNNMNALVNSRIWNGVSESDSVNTALLAKGLSVMRNSANQDNDNKNDFEITNQPSPGAENTWADVNFKIVINEIAVGYEHGDFIELYVADDGRAGLGINLAGFTITGDSGRFSKTFGQTLVKSGDYVLLTFDSSNTDQTEPTGTLLRLYTTYRGLDSNEGAIELNAFNLSLHDFMCYAKSDDLTEETRTRTSKAISLKEWQDSIPFYLTDFSDMVDARTITAKRSLTRNRFSADTDTKADFVMTEAPTPGQANGEVQVLHSIHLENDSEIVLRESVERKLTVVGRDVLGAVVRNVDNYVEISSDSGTAQLSADGISWQVSQLEKRFFEGEFTFFIKDSNPGDFKITIREKHDVVPKIITQIYVRDVVAVKINEIMYHPSSTQTPHTTEAIWVELKNGDAVDRDLSDYRLNDGINEFVVPKGTVISANSYLVICRFLQSNYESDPTSFADLYGDKDGKWELEDGFKAIEFRTLTLSTSGTLTFLTPDGFGISALQWDSSMGADGDGRSLERQRFDIESFGNIDIDRYNFVASTGTTKYGTPGIINSMNDSDSSGLVVNHEAITTHNILYPLYIHAEVLGAVKVELYSRSTEAVSYQIREMVKVEGTNVYRAVIQPEEILSATFQYYIRAWNGSEYLRVPSAGEAAPNSVAIVDQRNRISFETPLKVIGENESVYIDVKLYQQDVAITEVDLEVHYATEWFDAVDQDSTRPGIQMGVGSSLSGYFIETNSVDETNGVISLKFINPGGSAKGDLVITRLYFKSKSVIDRTDTFTVPITFEKAQFNTRNVDNILQGTLTLSKGTSWIIGREGGTITASNGAEIIVPENALLVPVTVNIRKLTIDEIPATNVLDAWNGIKSTKIAFEFLPDYLDFRRPVKIRIPWTTTELQYSKVEDSSKLKVYFWNHKSLAWERVGGHVNGNTVETDIDHFTIYMLVEDRQVLAPAASEIEFSPNPFSPNANGWNDVTNLSFILGNDADVTVEIYDVRGIKQRVVADRRRMFSGINKVEWDGRDDFGQILRTGIYIYRFRALETDGSLVTNQGTIVISTNLKDW